MSDEPNDYTEEPDSSKTDGEEGDGAPEDFELASERDRRRMKKRREARRNRIRSKQESQIRNTGAGLSGNIGWELMRVVSSSFREHPFVAAGAVVLLIILFIVFL